MANIENYIPYGKENAVGRYALAQITGLSDRGVRKEIQEARGRGVFIINDQNGSGYYLATSVQEIERQYRQDTARAMEILKRRKHMCRFLKAQGVKV